MSRVRFTPPELWIAVDGCMDLHGTSLVILLEETENGLELFVWADKTQEGYTHRISLEGAKTCPTNG